MSGVVHLHVTSIVYFYVSAVVCSQMCAHIHTHTHTHTHTHEQRETPRTTWGLVCTFASD